MAESHTPTIPLAMELDALARLDDVPNPVSVIAEAANRLRELDAEVERLRALLESYRALQRRMGAVVHAGALLEESNG